MQRRLGGLPKVEKHKGRENLSDSEAGTGGDQPDQQSTEFSGRFSHECNTGWEGCRRLRSVGEGKIHQPLTANWIWRGYFPTNATLTGKIAND